MVASRCYDKKLRDVRRQLVNFARVVSSHSGPVSGPSSVAADKARHLARRHR